MASQTITPIHCTRFDADWDEQETATILPENTGGDFISLHIDPSTDHVVTVDLTVEDAWALLRNLSRVIVAVENDD